jgi:hypothetical protein
MLNNWLSSSLCAHLNSFSHRACRGAFGLSFFFCLVGSVTASAVVHHKSIQLFRCMGSDGSVLVTSESSSGCHPLDIPDEATRALLHKNVPPHASKLLKKAPTLPLDMAVPPPSLSPKAWVALDSGAGQLLLPASALGMDSHSSLATSSLSSKKHTESVSPSALAEVAKIEGKILSSGGVPSRASMFRIVHPDGNVEYTNIRPMVTGSPLVSVLFTYLPSCVACDPDSKIPWKSTSLFSSYPDAIAAAAQTFGVDQSLIRAVIHAESSFHDHAISSKGAQGLMQLMPKTAENMGVVDAFDPTQNIMGGTKYLAFLLSSFHGDVSRAVAAYNAGPNAVTRYGGIPPYAETQLYVRRVRVLQDRYASSTKNK